MPEQAQSFVITCSACGTQLAAGLLSCPSCKALVHVERLKVLAGEAESHQSAGRLSDALASWRAALELLPPESRQHARVADSISALTRQVDASPSRSRSPWKTAGLGGLGAAGLLLWKFKFVVVFVLTKAKLLLLGLTKASTLFSMLLALGVYWQLWGWRFALGFVLAIYVHEMGHVAALRRYGIAAGAPMFIPGVGALVRMKQTLVDAREDARVGLAGPLWGLFATVAAYALGYATGNELFRAIGHTSAWLNLFNLLPLGSLDGGRGFNALGRTERFIASGGLLTMWLITGEPLLVLLLLVAVFRAFSGAAPAKGDRGALLYYSVLVVTLSLLTLPKPSTGRAPDSQVETAAK